MAFGPVPNGINIFVNRYYQTEKCSCHSTAFTTIEKEPNHRLE